MSTITTINASDLISDSRSVINTNFSNLNTDKYQSGSTPTFGSTTITTSGFGYLNVGRRTDVTTVSALLTFDTSTAGGVWSVQNEEGVLQFSSGGTVGSSVGTDRFTITAAGLVGIGSGTPSTSLHISTSTPVENVGKTIKLGTNVYVTSLDVNDDMYTTNNLYYDGAGWKTKINNTGAGIYLNKSSFQVLYGTNGGVDGASTINISFQIEGTLGSVVCGKQAALATNATDGFLYIPTSAGTPTGVPTAYTGKVAMVLDTTNNKLMIYDGGWIGVTLS